jgi:ABC-type glycerol-3-phosphate transport system substrate-binding protein
MIVEKEVIKEVPVEKAVIVEKEVPREIIKEVPKEVIKEVVVPQEVVKEVVKEVPVEKVVKETVVVEKEVRKAPPPGAPVIVRWVTDHYGGPRGQTTDYALARFKEEHPDIEVVLEPAPEVVERLMVSMAADMAPDIWLSSDDLMVTYPDIPLDLTPYFDSDPDVNKEDFMPFPAEFQRGGKIWGVPYQGNVLSQWINEDLFKEAGVPMPWEYDHDGDNWWDWDDFLETCKAITALGDDIYGVQLTTGVSTNYGGWSLSNGAYWIDEDSGNRICAFTNREKTEGAFHTEPVKEALKFIVDMECVHKVAMPLEEFAAARAAFGAYPFNAGLTGCAESTNEALVKASGLNCYRVQYPRSPRTKEAHTWLNNQPHQIWGETLYPDEAWEFVKFLSGREIQWKGGAELSAYQPSRLDIFADPEFLSEWPPVHRETYMYSAEQGGFKPMFDNYWEWNADFEAIMEEVRSCEGMSFEEAIAELDRMTTEILTR